MPPWTQLLRWDARLIKFIHSLGLINHFTISGCSLNSLMCPLPQQILPVFPFKAINKIDQGNFGTMRHVTEDVYTLKPSEVERV